MQKAFRCPILRQNGGRLSINGKKIRSLLHKKQNDSIFKRIVFNQGENKVSVQGQLQSALEALTHAAQRLDAASEIIAERKNETALLREKCEKLQEELDRAAAERDTAQSFESELNDLKAEKEELISVRNRLVAEKNQLLNERDPENNKTQWKSDFSLLKNLVIGVYLT